MQRTNAGYRVLTREISGEFGEVEEHQTLEDAIEAGELLVSSGEWDQAEIQHWEDGLFGWGWYRVQEINSERT